MRRPWRRLTRWWRYRSEDRALARRERVVIASGEARLIKVRSDGDSAGTNEVFKVVEREKRAARNARLRLATDYYMEQAAELLLPLPQDAWPEASAVRIVGARLKSGRTLAGGVSSRPKAWPFSANASRLSGGDGASRLLFI